MTDLSAEDTKLVTLARATRARTDAAEGAAVRDLDGRTYAAATVALPSLAISAVGSCIAMAVASGAKGLEAAVLLTGAESVTDDDLAALRDLAGPGVPVHVGDVRGTITGSASTLDGSNLRRVTPERGIAQHEQAVARLRASYDAIPAGQKVRLAKRTSNLFRPRAASTAPGLDVSGLAGVISIDADARTADVQGMCTYEDLVDATLPHGLIPLVVPQLRTITLGGAVTGLGIESTSFRSGLPHESVTEMDVFTGAGDVVTVRPGDAAVRRVRELLRLPRLRHPAADRARAGPRVREPAPRPIRRRRSAGQDDGRDRRDPRARRRPRRRARRHGVRAGGVLPDPRAVDRRRASTSPATTPASRSTTGRSSSGTTTC